MVRNVSGGGFDFSGLDRALRQSREAKGTSLGGMDGAEGTGGAEGGAPAAGKGSFAEMLAQGVKEVNGAAQESEKSSMDLATGRSSNIHETMLSATKAEMGFNMLVQLRNKAIEAYQEVMRMQV